MLRQVVGHYSLNISLLLYLVVYVPQLWHNIRQKKLIDLSLHFHHCLLLAYVTDLIYGFGLSMPWQYRLVSMVGTVFLLIQHKQLWKIYTQNRYLSISTCLLFLFIPLSVALYLLPIPASFFISVGYLSQIAGVIYTLPQIYKNMNSDSVLSLSVGYLLLTFLCAFCDNISAWFLQWPMPSKFGAMFNILTASILIAQWLWVQKKLKQQYVQV